MAHLSLEVIPMCEGVWVHLAIIKVELNLGNAVLVLEVYCEHKLVQECICDVCEQLLVLFYRFHV